MAARSAALNVREKRARRGGPRPWGVDRRASAASEGVRGAPAAPSARSRTGRSESEVGLHSCVSESEVEQRK